jgi:hypothetical protein
MPGDRARRFRLQDVDEIRAFGFGKTATSQPYPALNPAGTIRGPPGIVLSGDETHTSVRINDDQHQMARGPVNSRRHARL